MKLFRSNGHVPTTVSNGILVRDQILLVPWAPLIIPAAEATLCADLEERAANPGLRTATGVGWGLQDFPVEDLVRITFHRSSLMVPRR